MARSYRALNTMRDAGIQQVQVQQREGENEVIKH